MDNLQAMENNYENSVLESELIESQSTICNRTEEGVANKKTTSNNNIINNFSDQTKNVPLIASDEQTITMKSCEPISRDQSVKQVCTGSTTDNDCMSDNNDINKNTDIEDNLENNLDDETSVIFNENAVLKESLDIKSLNDDDKPASETSCNDLSLINSESLVSVNSQIQQISEQSEHSNCFGLLPEQEPSLLPSNSVQSTNFISSSIDNFIVISNSNAVPQSDSIVSSNFSLSQLRCYGSDESLNEDSLEVKTFYRDTNKQVDLSDKESDSDSSSTSSSSSILVSDSSDSDSEPENVNVPKPIKAKGELDLNDLPPIEDLKISVPEEECIPVGQVYQIVDKLVVIQAFKDKPALNLDSVLFSQEGKPFGTIFDVFGPVAEPYYCVRFNSNDHIKDKNICVNQMVYCAPKTKYTNYVFMAQLLKFKGSDASWVDDLEPPEMYMEYSDDEQEQMAKKKTLRKSAKNKQHSDPDEPASKKHFSYEKKMNKRNLQMTAARRKPGNKIENSLWSPSSTFIDVASSSNSSIPHQLFGRPPAFTARMPPTTGYFSPNPDQFVSNRFPHIPDVLASSPDRFTPVRNMFPPKPDSFPSASNRFLSRPDMFPPRPDMFPPRPDMFPPRPDMFPPRPDTFPSSSNRFPSRPDMFPPRPDTFPSTSNRFQPRHDKIQTRFDTFLPSSPILQSRPSNTCHGSNNPMHQPFNSVPPPNSIDSNFSSHLPHQIQPTISQGPMHNPQPISPIGPPRMCYNENNHTSRNSYPNQLGSPHGNRPNSNLWLQRPQSPSLGSASPNLWHPTQPNNQINPHAYPPSNPF